MIFSVFLRLFIGQRLGLFLNKLCWVAVNVDLAVHKLVEYGTVKLLVLYQILCAKFEQVTVNGKDILCLFIARFDKLAYLRIYLARDVFGIVLAVTVISAEKP